TPIAFLRVPIEGLVLVALVLVLPRRAAGLTAAIVGLLLAFVTLSKIVNIGFYEALNRPFNPSADWSYFQSAQGLLFLSVGQTESTLLIVGTIVLGISVILFTPLAMLRLTRLVVAHRTGSIRSVVALAAVWALCAAFGLQFVSNTPIA